MFESSNPSHFQGKEDHSGMLDIRRALHLAVVLVDDDQGGIEPHLA